MPPLTTALPATESVRPNLVRATSPAKSRLTIRLPDLSSVQPVFTDPRRPEPLASPTTNSADRGLAEAVENAPSGQVVAEAMPSPAWHRALPRKALDVIRQPKFWLACVVAVAVQVVLAFAMTPAEGVPDNKEPAAGAAQPWQKAAEEPAARIVVPAAPVSVADDHPDGAPAMTTPMGPALPFDATSDAVGHVSQPPTAEAAAERTSAAPMAHQHLPTAEGARVAGRPATQTDGATLGGIAPLDANVPPEKHEIR